MTARGPSFEARKSAHLRMTLWVLHPATRLRRVLWQTVILRCSPLRRASKDGSPWPILRGSQGRAPQNDAVGVAPCNTVAQGVMADRHPEVLASSASLEGWQPAARPSRRARARTSE